MKLQYLFLETQNSTTSSHSLWVSSRETYYYKSPIPLELQYFKYFVKEILRSDLRPTFLEHPPRSDLDMDTLFMANYLKHQNIFHFTNHQHYMVEP